MYQLRSRIWLEVDGEPFLGEGRVRLLEAIKEHGSISKAAKSLEMSYKKAWRLIDSINNASDKPLVMSNSGGQKGGGTNLTEEGLRLMKEFRKIQADLRTFLNNAHAG